MSGKNIDSPYKGSGQITREQFLFYEMRTTAKLMADGLDDSEILLRIAEDNLFQYPTEKTIIFPICSSIGRFYNISFEIIHSFFDFITSSKFFRYIIFI